MQPEAKLLLCLAQHRQQQIPPHPTGDQEGPDVAAQGDVETAAIGKLPCGAAHGFQSPQSTCEAAAWLVNGPLADPSSVGGSSPTTLPLTATR